MPAHDKTLWESWQVLWNGDVAVANEIVAPDFVAHFAPVGNSPGGLRGPEELTQRIASTLGLFTERGFATTVGPLVDGKLVAGRWIFHGTYGGGLPGTSDADSGRRVEYAGIDILRVEEGKIVEWWLCADFMQMLQQVGAIPS